MGQDPPMHLHRLCLGPSYLHGAVVVQYTHTVSPSMAQIHTKHACTTTDTAPEDSWRTPFPSVHTTAAA
jgi:hypothetical protein